MNGLNLGLMLGIIFSTFAMAGGNVQLTVSAINQLKYSDRASNHPTYTEVSVWGTTGTSDAVVAGLPNPLPRTIRLLFKTNDITQLTSLKACLDSAQRAKATTRGSFTVHLFMDEPNRLVRKIEGGATSSANNQFVIRADDSDFSSIGCEN